MLVLWDVDATKNVVSIKDLSSADGAIKRGSVVSMKWGNSSWFGQVLDLEDSDSDTSSDSDSVPLARLFQKKKTGKFFVPILMLFENLYLS